MSASTPPRLAALGVPRADCHHCGSCCSSFRVGPLLPDEAERVRAALPAVKARFPDHPVDEPFQAEVHEGVRELFLRKRDGYCTFFRPGDGCVIHAAVGAEEKPLVCQLFPLQVVRTDRGLRIGVRPTCLSDHRSWADGPPVPGAFIGRVLGTEGGVLDRELPVGEDVLLRLLQLPDLDTGTLLSFLAQRPDRSDPPDIGPWLEGRLDALLAEADAITGTGSDGLGPLHPATSTGTWLRRFWSWRGGRASSRWPEVSPALLPYLRDALARLVFVRQTALFPSLPWALLAYVAAARWASAFAVEASSEELVGSTPCRALPGDDVLHARFGPLFASWLTILEGPRMQHTLVQGGPPFA